MTDLLAARSQMAMSLAFHIIFSVIGIGLPLLMVIAEWRWLRTGDAVYLELAKRWAKGAAILFAVGAVSGTVLSFELGLLWPNFMRFAGPIIGMPFSLEGFAFFTEAIFLGLYLYGWDRVSRGAHLFAGIIVALSGVLSGIFVVIANAWMNAPTGFSMVDNTAVDIRPFAAMANSAAFPQTLHMTLAAYAATGPRCRRHSRHHDPARQQDDVPSLRARGGARGRRASRDPATAVLAISVHATSRASNP
jgi:cytochrome d ubiquinol oxidase subunit I